MKTKIKTNSEIANLRIGGRMLAEVLAICSRASVSGVTTKELADLASRELNALGGKPAFLGYNGFPDVICISLNDEVVHGIPSNKRQIQDGDILSLDFGVNYNGMITDSAISLIVGNKSTYQKAKLLNTTKAALDQGIAAVIGGVKVGDIAHAIETVLQAADLGVVRELVGHGVGHQLHEEPNIPNYGQAGSGPQLQSGMTIAIEPMATLGGYRIVFDHDGWTVRTADHSLAAHFEHTVLITDVGSEILTI